MEPLFRQYLQEGSQAGVRYALSVPQRVTLGTAGMHVGSRAGSSLEFKDHREYQSGDDLRRIDWNAYARSDKLIVKLYREEINPHLDIVIDGSQSMRLEDTPKCQATLGLAALFAEASANSGYTHAAWIVRNGCEKVANGANRPHVWDGIAFDATEPLPALLNRTPPNWYRQGVRVLISDLLWMDNPLHTLQHLARNASTIYVIQVLARADMNPEDQGNLCFVDSETGELREIYVDATVTKRYRERLAQHQQNWHVACKQVGARLTTVIAEDAVSNWHLDGLLSEEILKLA